MALVNLYSAKHLDDERKKPFNIF